MRIFYQIPMDLQWIMPACTWRMDRHRRAVYLTFDDGPIPEVTPALLDILQHYNVKATFFMVGENAEKHPELLEAIRKAGHSIGNHTYHHTKGWKVSRKTYMEDIRRTEELIGHSGLFRPPYGRLRLSQIIAARRAGYGIYLWDVLTHDYNANYSPERMLRIIRNFTRPGSIVNFHDSIKSNERMLATIPKAIEWWQNQGYEILPLPARAHA